MQARYRGSVPQELKMRLLREERAGRLDIILDEVAEASYKDSQIYLTLNHGSTVADRVLLATGFHATPPGIHWLNETIEKEHLQCATCGYPIISEKSLEWGKNLYVIGALSELVVGPVARNISGARRGAERIVSQLI
ncbi:hypothetical protein JCM9140_584 [Halalkalibacter wakoensis JCM 9140]|uniref:Thioredoxin reductase n=2 Tax=Halalkalibacter wakoensis TaxID=127891 RepID=W4PXR1_9BACI|nr:hypothetical protein JCM9140_584 [Halalkalibacter wakoensis JCM 9140]